MTLEETIKHAEEVAKEMNESAKAWQKAKDRGNHGWSKSDIENVESSIIACSKYAAEHRQLAEWLKDYKRLKEQEPCEDTISRQAVFDAMRKNHRSEGRDIDGDYIEGDYRESLYDDIISIPPVTPKPKTGQFAKWVAREIFDDMWEYNKDAFAELACRKLEKIGIVKANGDKWELVDPQKSDNYN